VTSTSYVSVLSLATITYTQTQCVNPTVTILTLATTTVSAWPAGTTTVTSQFRCGLRGSRVPPPHGGIIAPQFRSGGPPIPGLWPPAPIPGLMIPPASTSRNAVPEPKTTQTYTVTHRTVVATVTVAAEEKRTASRDVCAG
jgi:hypothetical protein